MFQLIVLNQTWFKICESEMAMSGNLYQGTNKNETAVNKRELHLLRTGDPRRKSRVDILRTKSKESQGKSRL